MQSNSKGDATQPDLTTSGSNALAITLDSYREDKLRARVGAEVTCRLRELLPPRGQWDSVPNAGQRQLTGVFIVL